MKNKTIILTFILSILLIGVVANAEEITGDLINEAKEIIQKIYPEKEIILTVEDTEKSINAETIDKVIISSIICNGEKGKFKAYKEGILDTEIEVSCQEITYSEEVIELENSTEIKKIANIKELSDIELETARETALKNRISEICTARPNLCGIVQSPKIDNLKLEEVKIKVK